jgi:hypothetical protein
VKMRKSLEGVLARRVDRREFLLQTGGAVLSLVGVTAMIRSLTLGTGRRPAGSYGSAAYAGTGKGARQNKRDA